MDKKQEYILSEMVTASIRNKNYKSIIFCINSDRHNLMFYKYKLLKQLQLLSLENIVEFDEKNSTFMFPNGSIIKIMNTAKRDCYHKISGVNPDKVWINEAKTIEHEIFEFIESRFLSDIEKKTVMDESGRSHTVITSKK